MDKYRYKVEWVNGTQTRKDNDRFEVRLQELLTRYGDDGWRLANISYSEYGAELIFERAEWNLKPHVAPLNLDNEVTEAIALAAGAGRKP